jgi:hypothetical protein
MVLPPDSEAPIYDALRRETTIKSMAAAGRSMARAFAQFGELINAFATGITEGMKEEMGDGDDDA